MLPCFSNDGEFSFNHRNASKNLAAPEGFAHETFRYVGTFEAMADFFLKTTTKHRTDLY